MPEWLRVSAGLMLAFVAAAALSAIAVWRFHQLPTWAVIVVAVVVFAGSFMEIIDWLDRPGWEPGRHEKAEQRYRRAADLGEADAMNDLGLLLEETGRAEEAEQWYRRAADIGDASAMTNLGVLLEETGRAEEAEQWYRRAADIGDAAARRHLGVLLEETGRAEEAKYWFR